MSGNNLATVQRMAEELKAGQGPYLAKKDQLEALIKAVNDIAFRLDRIERHLHINTVPSVAGPKLAAIPELLEPILLHLPMRDLLLAQRVNQTFKEVIENSADIQRALFFKPESTATPLRETDVRVNPLLADMKSYISIPLYKTTKQQPWTPVFMEGAGWNTGKLRIVRLRVKTATEFPEFGSVHLSIFLRRLPGTDCYDRVERVGQSVHGSWRRMYLTQPPVLTWWSREKFPNNSMCVPSGDSDKRLGDLWSWEIPET